ncbi:lipoprotein-releasing ABC transporter permease subunit [Chrysiogenes arsenatis]|uniref:lipoprotein-releasing ABC transporter permease subunit n=1 Tax=Chrysiogenes arsenatis TaxID=309797 RepID=UPI000429C43E|nr:lipoprotein-releasing ABC transporter permease subunit [Chrysiogenes arsenatis]
MYELTIAWRNLRGRKKEKFISFISLMSVIGIAIGVAALIIVISVMKGFEIELREKILGASSHLMVTSYDGVITEFAQLEQAIARIPGIDSVNGVLYSSMMIMGQKNISGMLVKGVEPEGYDYLNRYIVRGSLADLRTPNSIILGEKLVEKYALVVGDPVSVLAPSGRIGPFGSIPKRGQLILVGVLRTGMYEYDNSLAFSSIDTMTEFGGYSERYVNSLEIRVQDIFNTQLFIPQVREAIGPYYSIRDWSELNSTLFSALKLERVSMFLILCIIVIVASFNIISTLVMMVMEKTREIGILMSMGATRRSIQKIFFLQGIIIGSVGTLAGTLFGVILSLLLKRYQFVKLPEDVYMLNTLPVQLEWLTVITVIAVSLAISMLATYYPSLRAGKLHPVDALRNE